MTDYIFSREIKRFKLDDYTPYMGWLGNKTHKIYTHKDLLSFFVYDEFTDRLFEFELADREKLNKATIYDCLVNAYLALPETQI
ncbi:hypothetical protein [Dyadobacter chenhuakuii]|uniref:Uncharacterized protein n=1 Tax=Dyadobacter chenhuakuii TaxID=2909339 RepID=A0A9X1QKK5_9BACT|nr:hypothetical protein [Dyadobacter chenhuakuii]MCF2501379.1 hypothetical protein [Dyadobacter chenhuakuii]